MTEVQLEKAKKIDYELKRLKEVSEALKTKNTNITVHTNRFVDGRKVSLDAKFNEELKKIVDKDIERLEKELEAL